jgi:hypothetical protein
MVTQMQEDVDVVGWRKKRGRKAGGMWYIKVLL